MVLREATTPCGVDGVLDFPIMFYFCYSSANEDSAVLVSLVTIVEHLCCSFDFVKFDFISPPQVRTTNRCELSRIMDDLNSEFILLFVFLL